jgi:AraC-like DNA-binding protein
MLHKAERRTTTTKVVRETEAEAIAFVILARDLRDNPGVELRKWTETIGIRPETVSRGFRRAFGVSPQSFQAKVRLLQALPRIRRGEKVAQVATECGFADQAQLSRHFRILTGGTPRAWRS